jgi:hypothetical protein
MIRKTLTTIMASVLAVAIGSAALTVPALAGGSISIGYAPTDPDEARALSAGMQIYSLVNGLKNGSISQNGFGNIGGIAQNGSGNNGILVQEGNGHNGTIEQNGNNNSCGLFQFGENTDGSCVQNGDGQAAATVQFGW